MTLDLLNDEPAAIARLLEQIIEDRSKGRSRSDAEYRSLYPGHERAIERELASLRGEEPESLEIAGYRVLDELGRGGQGVVYLADDPVLPRRVALKVLNGLVNPPPGVFLRLRREAEVMASIDHPGICPVYAVGLAGGAPWIAMRHLEGETLKHAIAERCEHGQPPDTRAAIEADVRLVARIARAMSTVHAAGVVHRDLKPGNVMLDRDGAPVVLDFGLAQTDDSTLTISGDVVGSPAYMSPEQVQGRPLDARADVWALGVVLYELLTLQRPFAASSTVATLAAIQDRNPEPLRRMNHQVPRDVEVIAATAMERDLERRYPDMAAFADDLEAWLERRPIAARPAGIGLRTLRWVQRHPARALGTVALVVVLTVAAIAIRASLDAQRLETREQVAAAMSDLEQAYVELGRGSASRATALFERAGDVLPDKAERVAGLALAHLREGRADEANRVLDAALEHEDATVLMHVRDYVNGTDSASDASIQDPIDGFVRGVVALYDARHEGGDYALALDLLRSAVHTAPSPPALYRLQLLTAADGAGDDVAARQIAHGLSVLWPKSPLVRLLAGRDAAGALAADPQFTLALRERAREQLRDGDADGAYDQIERAVALDGDDATTRLEFGRTLLALHDQRTSGAKAIRTAGPASAADPLARAIAELERAANLAPQDQEISSALADARALASATPSDTDSTNQ